MHIVVIQETDWLERGPHQQHHLFERLSLRGHHITVLDYPILRHHYPAEPLRVPRREFDNAARIYDGATIRLITPATVSISLFARLSSVFTHALELRRIILHEKPDLIVSYALSTGLLALMQARAAKIAYIFHVIDALHAIVPVPILRPIANLFERFIFTQADHTVLINKHLRDYAIKLGSTPPTSRVLRTGVDLNRFTPLADDDPQRVDTREALDIASDDVILFFMGWLYDFSGVREVAESLREHPDHVRLLVVGNGDQLSELESLRDAELGDRLILTGRVPYEDIPAYLAAADVLLLPFHTVPETRHIVPIKLYEYMATGKPVIATPLPGVMGDIGDDNGLTYAPTDEQAATALDILPRGDQLGALSRQYVEDYCDWEKLTTEFETFLQKQVKRGR